MPCLPRNRAGLAIRRGNFGAGACAPSARRYRRCRRGDASMPDCFEPKIGALPKAQQDIWPKLSPAPRLSFVLYGGTAVALYLGHRVSVDFDFFRSSPLDKNEVEIAFAFMRDARTIQESENTLVVDAPMPSGAVKVSFFGGMSFGRINQPRQTNDSTLLVASMDDLLSTKLKAILDRAAAEDYLAISAMLS